jgi:general secretion pathway protein G
MEPSQDPRERLEADLMALHYALEEYAVFNGGSYPGELTVLVEPDEHGYRYLPREELPLDPWGRAYHYQPPVTGGEPLPRIWSLGRDGEPGGVGLDLDLDNLALLDGDGR